MFNSTNFLIALFPILWVALTLIGMKVSKKGEFNDEFLSLDSTTCMKGFAALGIILHHITQLNTNYGQFYKGPVTAMNETGVLFTAIFFFLSGYGLVTSYRTKPDYLKGFLTKRLPAVLIPFIMSNIIYFLIAGLGFGATPTTETKITGLLGWTLINTNTWFLVEIIILYVAFFFSFRFIKNKKISMAVMLVFSLLLITGSLFLAHDYSEMGGHWFKGEWWYNTTIMFFIGLCFGFGKEKITESFKSHYLAKLIISILIFAGLFYVNKLVLDNFGYWTETEVEGYVDAMGMWIEGTIDWGYGDKALTLLNHTILIISFMTMLLLLNLKIKFGNKALNFIGRISLELYIIHDLFRVIFGSILALKDALLYLTVLTASIPAALLLHYLDRLLLKPFKEKKARL